MEVLTRLLFLLMTLISWSVCQDQRTIKAEPGQNVILPCKGSKNCTVTFLKLIRPDLDPEYVLVYRDDRIYEQFQNPRFKGRTELQSLSSSDGNVNVILHNMTEDDSGTYVCRVRCDTDGATSERIIQLNLVPPGNGQKEDGVIKDEKDTLGNILFYVAAACAGIILTVLIIALAIIIRKKNKKSMSSPLDGPMTRLKLNVSAKASSKAQCSSTLSLVNEN